MERERERECTLDCEYFCAVVDIPMVLKIIYMLCKPEGVFHPAKYDPPRRAKQDPSQMFVSLVKV